MYKKWFCLMALLCSSCQSTAVVAEPPPEKAKLFLVAQQLTADLTRFSVAYKEEPSILVTTPVDAAKLASTNPLAIQLQQDLMTTLQQLGYHVKDMNVSDTLRAAEEGTFILTRDWQKIAADVSVSHVLVSSMDLTKNGVEINARMIDLSDNRVASAANIFVPAVDLPGYLTESTKSVSRNGVLYRQSESGKVQFIGAE
ncbi:FlgO family outer membrane protein [Shewanella sp. C32]|uniref:FlgO family outer membrane protein n=1 Tax=Shewanella electrica TaxID=515560 RepID=A0ABT2FJF2_9GAMM|nr:FlgO family outer membrane protein [Shewanella electrica]MCH1924542.1 FlgO family outer membrane protein [Shewanella electrica]MCS4556443.1 FlgO family outer membrane protein [Shewanella electrica]